MVLLQAGTWVNKANKVYKITHEAPENSIGRGFDRGGSGHVVHERQFSEKSRLVVAAHLILVDVYIIISTE